MDQQDQEEIEVPPYFLCPISIQIMKDPVTVSTGITYDRDNIEKWLLTNKNPTCPVTKQSLIDTDCLTPNHTLRRLIQSWCTLNAFERYPTPKPLPTKAQILKLFNQAIKSPRNRAKYLNELKSIALENTANKRCLEAAGAVQFLLRIHLIDSECIDDALSVLSHLHISKDMIKSFIEESEGGTMLIVSLVRAMQRGSYEARTCAVELMKLAMQVVDPARMVTLKRDLFEGLVQVLRDPVSPKAVKSALQVLNLACPWGRNRVNMVESGAVRVLIDQLLGCTRDDKRMIEITLLVLEHLCRCAEGRAEVVRHPAGLAVVSKKILRVSPLASTSGVKILNSISRFLGSPAVVEEMLQLGVVAKLCLVVQMDCEIKTKERAKEILKLHEKAWRKSPCASTHVFASLRCR